jgi:glutamyl-tRNA synthetase/glutamyl-Q tRNA(Asp) synthetase
LTPVITRFAPAPTGYLHLGHVVNAIHVWGLARSKGGEVRLRIEDHDRQRSRPEFEVALLEDLDWLGFAADGPMVRQSDRDDQYRTAVARLAARGLLYGCACTRAAIAAATRARAGGPTDHPSSDALPDLRYAGTCRDRGIPLTEGVGWRLRLAPGEEAFDDEWLGPQRQDPAEQCGDLLIRDRLGNWTYQFAVVVDDMEQGITHVVRGLDLMASTGRQIRLARLLGRGEPPVFAHHPLIMKTATEKLSKSDGATAVRALRAAGWTPAAVVDHARRAVSSWFCPLNPRPANLRFS